MDNHMLVCQIKNVKDLVAFVSGTINTGKRDVIILHLLKDCISAMSDSEFQQMEKILLDPYVISVLIIDCDFSMSLYERIYVFDLCFISQEGALWFDPEQRNGLRFLQLLFAPKSFLGKKARILNCKELVDFGLANALLRKENFYEDLESQICNLTLGRTREQLFGIKSCMNAYKKSCVVGESTMTDPETGSFCQLALIKLRKIRSDET